MLVAIEDAKGKVVRHLVAGMLGKNPPAPLQPNSLAQTLTWDGKDDFGKALPGQYLKEKIPTRNEGNPPQAEGLDSAAIGPLPASNGGIRVDLQGNSYVGLRLQPKDYLPPKELAKDPAYATWTGSIVKFGPEGGTVVGAVKEDDLADGKGEQVACGGSMSSGRTFRKT